MKTLLLFGSPGPMEIVGLIVLVLLLFGGKKIPELMKGLGNGIREFNSAKNTIKEEIEEGMKEPEVKKVKEETKDSE